LPLYAQASKIEQTNYLFLTSLLRAREAEMLTREKLEQMLESRSFDDACRIAADCGYPDMSGMHIREVEDTLSDHRHAQMQDIENMIPDTELLDLFRLKFDYHSAKALVKSEGHAKHLITFDGRGSAESLLKYFMQKDLNMLPIPLAESIREATSMLSRTGNPCLADLILDRAYFGELKALAAQTGLPFAIGYVELLIDVTNLKTLIRSRAAGKRPEIAHELLFEGGAIDREQIAAVMDADEEIVSLFAASGLADAARRGVEFLSGGSMTVFERTCDNAVLEYLSDASRIGFGPEVVIEYLAGLENEIVSLRIILTGKLMGIDGETLRERLRESYV